MIYTSSSHPKTLLLWYYCFSVNPCHPDAANAWRLVNYGLKKILEITKVAKGGFGNALDGCRLVPIISAGIVAGIPVNGFRIACELPAVIGKIPVDALFFAAEIALALSEKIYSDVCTVFDDICK